MKPRILIAEPAGFSGTAIEILRQVADVDLLELAESDLPRAFDTYDVFWFRLGFRIGRDLLENARTCRLIACPVTGLDHIDLAAAEEQGIGVISLRGETSFLREIRSTAEHTLALILALQRHIPAAIQHVHRGLWERDEFQGHEIYQKTAGVVGLGRLGSIVATYLNALGMQVVGFDPGARGAEFVRQVSHLEDLLRVADVVTIHASYTDPTHHLIDEAAFSQMKPEAILVNTSRGGLVDEAALVSALENQTIRGAALDVIQNEHRISQDNPLIRYSRTHRNLIIVPHLGGNTADAFEKTECFVATKVVDQISRNLGA